MRNLILFSILAIFLISCRKEAPVIKVSYPYSSITGYMGQPGISYPDTALERLNRYVQPKGYLATYKGRSIYFSTRDTLLHVPIPEYRKMKLDAVASDFYPQVFGDRLHPNDWAYLSVSSLNFRVDHSVDGTDFPPDYTVEYPYLLVDTLFDGMRPF